MTVEAREGVVLAHNKQWPSDIYSMITGFIEPQESPVDAACRETEEELGLKADYSSLVGVYPYTERNQIVLVYHVRAEGSIVLGEEIDQVRVLSREELRGWPFGQDQMPGWPFGAGWAIRDWLDKTC